MITRILWIVSLLCAVCAQQQATSQIDEYTFTAIVQDSGKFMGAKCDSKEQKCKKYMDNVCEFIKKPLLTSGPHPFGCEVMEHGDRSKDNTIDVTVKLQLLVKDTTSDLTFTVTHSTFGAVLKQSLIYLHNTPDANVTITGVVSPTPAPQPTPPEKPVVLEVSGNLHDKTGAVTDTPTETEQCEIVKQLFNQDLGSDLLNVMYKYSPKHLILPFDPMTNGAVKFQIIYPEEFFKNTSIDYTKDFKNTINWGFKNSAAKNKYHLGENTVVTLKQPATAPGAGAADITYKEPNTIPFEFTASVKDDGKLYGKTCGDPKEECTEYKQRLCQLAQKPIRCGRVPTSWQSCSVDVLSERQADKSLQAKIKLMLLEEAGYRITYAPLDSCPTFAGMYKLAFASQSANPKLDVTEFTPTLKPVAITTEKVDIQIQGTLQHKGSPVKSTEWKKKAEEKVKKDLLALSLPDEMLNTFYHFPDRQLESFEIDTKSENVIATITISYPKTVFEANAIDPGCDLNGMLQWGIRSAKTTKEYSFSADDTVVKNSAASERPVSFTFTATVTDNGKFQGAECSGESGDCIEYKEKLCAFVRKPFTTSEIESEDGCVIDILEDRTDNALKVRISLQLNMHASKVPFDIHCPTFGWALNQAFIKLYNTPDAALVIDKIETLHDPPKQPEKNVELAVSASLYRNGELVNGRGWEGNEKCEVIKQLLNLDMGEDLLNVMYKYNKDNINLKGIKFTAPGKVDFNLLFNKAFFTKTNIIPDCNFEDTLKWGFQHAVAKDQFYLGNDTTVGKLGTASDLVDQATTTLTYTAQVDDNLNGHECHEAGSECAGYKNELCQIIKEPLLCTRVPNLPGKCKITVEGKGDKPGKLPVKVELGVRKDNGIVIPPISEENTCKTFMALHKLAFTTFYEQPPVNITIEKPSGQKTATSEKTVDFIVTGTLKEGTKTAESVPDLYELNYQLANLNMPGKLLQAVYKYNKARTFAPVKPETTTLENGAVEFKIGFKETFLSENGINPQCDLAGMLKWGFGQSSILDKYRLEVTDVKLETTTPPAGGSNGTP